MKRSLPVMLSVVILTAMIFIPSAIPASAYSINYHFDNTLAPWLPGSDFGTFTKGSLTRTEGEGSPLCSIPDTGYATLTDYYLLGKGHGSWMVAAIESKYWANIDLRWNANNRVQSPDWCDEHCFATAYIGNSLPVNSDEFVTVSKLSEGWQDYHYAKRLITNGTVYIAVGWHGRTTDLPDLGIELYKGTAMVVDIDCLSVTAQALGK